MEHITEELVGRAVVTPDGAEVGKVTAVEDDKAIVDAETGVAAEMADSVAPGDDRLAIEANQIAAVTDDNVQLVEEFRKES
ncbi:hypothetical protein AUR64_08470 [Haloprofundus marisrubri]|uniref:PRC-barrel domain-containing protein n=1 Tax=Haloprofundus marisrubri TaxID=1514971 RepID=A0A0W1R7Q6_9EURY|nr:hypothetical protein [Haloprofundus marisrubri]KTG09668.1 hypothetical protein AUR64_08470 [Haloprofundus marisrubri]